MPHDRGPNRAQHLGRRAPACAPVLTGAAEIGCAVRHSPLTLAHFVRFAVMAVYHEREGARTSRTCCRPCACHTNEHLSHKVYSTLFCPRKGSWESVVINVNTPLGSNLLLHGAFYAAGHQIEWGR